MKNSVPDDEISGKLPISTDGPDRDGKLSRGVSNMAIFVVVALIGAVQVTNWVLGRGKTSDRLKIL